MDKDLNPSGSLFGGRALEWIDEEAAIYAITELKYPTQLVTKLMSTIDFKAPARKGDIIEIGMKTVAIGTTSITVECSIRNKRTQQEILRVEKIVMVNIGTNGKPVAHNVMAPSISATTYDLTPEKAVETAKLAGILTADGAIADFYKPEGHDHHDKW